MSGPTAAQENLQDQQAAFYQQATQEATATYGEDQALLTQMQSVFDPILAKGPQQEGFSAPEVANLKGQAIEGTATNYAGAAKAVNEQLAARGGGTNPLPSGGDAELKEEVADSAAEELSKEETQINEADYAEGEKQFGEATSALEDVSGQYNPTAYEGGATSAGSAEEKTASDIAEESDSWENAAIGAAGSLGSAALTGFCPAKGSMFLMYDGSWKKVEDLGTGDKLLGIDGAPQTIEKIQTAFVPILRVTALAAKELLRKPTTYVARNSWSHAFALPVGGFVTANNASFRRILGRKGPCWVESVTPDGQDTVYNVMTDGSHTYCADGLWAVGDAELIGSPIAAKEDVHG